MPTKCRFCQLKYSRSGAYEKHLRNPQANLHIVLACTIQYVSSPTTNDDPQSNILPHEGYHPLDSYYESDSDPTGHEYSAFDDISHESISKKYQFTPYAPNASEGLWRQE